MAKNINSLQLLRNTKQLYATKEAAISGITGSDTNDGTIKLARYEVDGKNGKEIRTIFGIYSVGSEISGSSVTGGSYTIYDSPQEVIAELTKRLDTLQGDGNKEGSVANSIQTAINALNAGSFGGTGKVITTISETNGKISATAIDLAASAVSATAIASGDTTIALTGNTVAAQIADLAEYIGGLDVAKVGGTGKVITTISETNGKISAAAIDLKAENVAASAIGATNETVAVTGTTVAAQIGSLAKSVKATSVDAKSYSISAVTLSDENVKEAYALFDEDNVQAGEAIKIYKDSSLVSLYAAKEDTGGTITVGDKKYSKNTSGQTLIYEYINASGETVYAAVDLGNFLIEEEFKNGLQVSGGTVSVKIDAASEGFLTVGADGVKLSGVQAAINTAANKAATEVVVDAEGHVTVTKTTGTNNQAIYTIGENDIASAKLLGTTASTNGETSAFGYIAKEVANREAAIQTQKNALDAEIAARKAVDGQSGSTYAANTAATYISGATSLNDADVKLNDAINAEKSTRKTEDTKIVAGVGLTDVNGAYKIAANTGAGIHITSASTVQNAIYTLDNALAAAKKANTLVNGDNTVVVEKVASGDYEGNTSVRVNIASNTNDSHKFVTFDNENKKFYFTEAILDAGTY